jgi:ribosomal protein L37AE/L43A
MAEHCYCRTCDLTWAPGTKESHTEATRHVERAHVVAIVDDAALAHLRGEEYAPPAVAVPAPPPPTTDVYQCLACGARWAHGGMEASWLEAQQHAAMPGHEEMLVGEIEALAETRRRRAVDPAPAPLQVPDLNKPEILPAGQVMTWGAT